MESTVERACTSLAYLTLHSINVLCYYLRLIRMKLDTFIRTYGKLPHLAEQ